MDFERIHLDYSGGQHEYVVVARDEGIAVGKLEYSFYEGTPYVKMIEAFIRGERVGTGLILELQRLYPETAIEFGTLTEDGAALLGSIEWRVPNTAYSTAMADLQRTRNRLQEYAIRAEALVGATQVERDAFKIECSDWNDLYDEEDRALAIVRHAPAEFRFAIGGKPRREMKLDTLAMRP